MENTIFASLALYIPFTAFAQADTPPRFKHVAEFLAWADQKLIADDYDGLVSAQTDTKDTREVKIVYVKGLDVQLGDTRLSKIFDGREFPKDADTFKLGGHQSEIGHYHIDFLKNGDSWQITKIWQCR